MSSAPLAPSKSTSATNVSMLKPQEIEKSTAASTAPSVMDAYSIGDAEKASTPTPPEQPTRTYSGWSWFCVCASLYASCFLYGLDTTIVADIQAATVETFGDVSKLGWLGIGFPLGSVATILTIGKAFGIFDHKWLYLGSLVMFEAGSALCGGAPNMDALIVGRVWAGVGGAGMYLGVLNIIAVNTTIRERPIYTSVIGLCWGIGCILGPVIGGAFADSSATWRWAFYINLILFAVGAPVYFFLLKSYMPQPSEPLSARLRQVDWLGVTLNALVYVLFVIPVTLGGTTWPWSDGRTIALFVLFGVVLVAFTLTQTFSILTTPSTRLFPIDFLRRRTLVLLYICQASITTGLFIPIYYIPLFFSFVFGRTGVQSAVGLLPFICINIFCTMLNGALMPRFGYYQPWYVVSFAFLIVGGATMYALVDATTSESAIYGFSILMAIGAGLAQQAAYSVAAAKVPAARIADAVGFINTAQIGSTTIALTITSAVFQNVAYREVARALEGLDFGRAEIQAALAGAKSEVFQSVSAEVRERVVMGIVRGISDGWILVIVGGAVGLVASLGMRMEKLFLEITAGG